LYGSDLDLSRRELRDADNDGIIDGGSRPSAPPRPTCPRSSPPRDLAQPPPGSRDSADAAAARKLVFDNVLRTAQKLPRVANAAGPPRQPGARQDPFARRAASAMNLGSACTRA
jgi:hypothetical protein